MTGKLGQNFKAEQRVEINRTMDTTLDKQQGTIIGRSADDGICCFYIVLLDTPYNGYRGITMIESCLDLV